MRVTLGVAILAILAGSHSALAQDLTRACLRSTSAGGATINCLKASVLLQRAQLQELRNLREALARSTERSVAATNAAAARTGRVLDSVARTLQAGGGPTATYPFIDDLSAIKGSTFACPSGDCAADAKVAADRVCRQLKFAGQHAFDFEDSDDLDAPKRMRWVACRR